MKKLFVLLLVVFLMYTCKKDTVPQANNSIAGKFFLGLSSSLKSNLDSSYADSTTFNLGTLKASRSFSFSLANIGQQDITNITITSDNANFSVIPSTIQVLKGTKNGGGLTQNFTLDIVHGLRLNGVGYASLLNMGTNTSYLTITGQTTDGMSTINLSFKAKIQVFAMVMDIELYQGGLEFDLPNPTGYAGGLGVASMPLWYFKSSPEVQIKNIGNTVIDLSLFYIDVTNDLKQNSTLNPNETITLNLPIIVNSSSENILKLDAQGTICNQHKLSIGPDGDGYLMLTNLDYNAQPIDPPVDSTKVYKIKRVN